LRRKPGPSRFPTTIARQARIGPRAVTASKILVSRTVRELVELRGVPGTWQLLAVDRHGPRAGSAEAELASTPTPEYRAQAGTRDIPVLVLEPRNNGEG
jgi:hypothetical protein